MSGQNEIPVDTGCTAYISETDVGFEVMSPSARCQPPRTFAIAQDCLAAEEDNVRIIDGKTRKQLLQGRVLLPFKRLTALEIRFSVEFDRPAESGFEWRVIRPDVGAPGTVSLFQAQ